MNFNELNLTAPILKAIDELGFTQPTPIQEKVFSVAMSGRDLIGIAQTGTGKTLAYLLPTIRLWKYSKDTAPQILIIVPTRELVTQIVDEIEKLSKYTNLAVVGIYGGVNIKPQMEAVYAKHDILVATPGRLIDLKLKGVLRLSSIKKLIIDEIDEMLNLGLQSQLEKILEIIPVKRQNMMFSATITKNIEKLLLNYFNEPIRIEDAPVGTPLEKINQIAYYLPNFFTKINLLRSFLVNSEVFKKVLVFSSTKKLADKIYELIEPEFIDEIGLMHSNKAQNTRLSTIKQFHEGDYRIVISTDIMARGIDISDITHVINFDIPDVAENYIHRIGRTGRAEKNGTAISFILKGDKEILAEIEKLMQYQIPIEQLPSDLEISHEKTEEEKIVYQSKYSKINSSKGLKKGKAFHEKSDKNQKVNVKVRWADKMKEKYGKPKTRGQKKK